jgi:hypothetical protein
MKDSHIYQRMNNPKVVKGYLNTILHKDFFTAKTLFGNITLAANDHPRYQAIVDAYQNRVNRENNKE